MQYALVITRPDGTIACDAIYSWSELERFAISEAQAYLEAGCVITLKQA
jgi:hypothetical protein